MSDNLFWIIIILAFAVVSPLVQSWIRSKYKRERGPDEARNVLETRYALGELSDDEFAHRMETLTEQRVSYAKKTLGTRHLES